MYILFFLEVNLLAGEYIPSILLDDASKTNPHHISYNQNYIIILAMLFPHHQFQDHVKLLLFFFSFFNFPSNIIVHKISINYSIFS